MKVIVSTNGFEIQVSDEDFGFLNLRNWEVTNNGQSVRSTELKHEPIAKAILKSRGVYAKQEVDHKDRNPLNNQFENLRPANRQQNGANRGVFSNNTTGCKGVSFDRPTGKYLAHIRVKGLLLHIGRFQKLEEAGKAYDRAARKYFGDFAFLNFPGDKP
jgi:hypothetical protein